MNDLMEMLKQNEKFGKFTSSLYICHTKAMTYSILIVRSAS